MFWNAFFKLYFTNKISWKCSLVSLSMILWFKCLFNCFYKCTFFEYFLICYFCKKAVVSRKKPRTITFHSIYVELIQIVSKLPHSPFPDNPTMIYYSLWNKIFENKRNAFRSIPNRMRVKHFWQIMVRVKMNSEVLFGISFCTHNWNPRFSKRNRLFRLQIIKQFRLSGRKYFEI